MQPKHLIVFESEEELDQYISEIEDHKHGWKAAFNSLYMYLHKNREELREELWQLTTIPEADIKEPNANRELQVRACFLACRLKVLGMPKKSIKKSKKTKKRK